jgi:hypothetical protein
MILLLSVGAAFASEVISLQVTNRGDLYMLESENYLEASVESVFQVLMDYDNYTRLSSVYQESRQMAPGPDGSPRVYTLARGCIVFVCRSVEKVERLDIDPERRIVATVIPELSNLKQGETEWVLSADGAGTRLTYRMQFVPRFWIPPLIGPPMMRHVLARSGADDLQQLENLARDRDLAQPDMDH